MVATSWNLVTFLRSIYNLLKDCPARRANYIAITNSSLFPLKFCAVRWLDNAKVAERALHMLPSLKTFVKEMRRTGEISSQSFKTVVASVDDPFLPAKLEFFKSLASDLEPFLREFQSDQPLSPFLYDRLNTVIRTQMERVVLAPLLTEKAVKDVDLKKENLRLAKHVILGIGVKSALRCMDKQPDSKMLAFKEECKSGLMQFIEKMLDRSPIRYKLTKSISCLSPAVAAEPKLSHARMESVLTALLEAKWLNTIEADQAQRLFNNITKDSELVNELKKFKKSQERLDHFWIRIIKHLNNCTSLVKVVKLVSTLSHGNANVERGFSVNRECLVDNMHEELLIAQRTVYDHVLSVGGVEKVDISKPLINAARNSYQIYKESLTKKQIQMEASSIKKLQKRAAEKELKELEEKRAKVLEEAQQKAELLSDQINKIKNVE
uniref:HAT C-terminal dimerisation domain-containing protein n=1 Tax=Graphocephala atropunctata TaxID=36148 RepID=A0A1B6KMG3_9HEMI